MVTRMISDCLAQVRTSRIWFPVSNCNRRWGIDAFVHAQQDIEWNNSLSPHRKQFKVIPSFREVLTLLLTETELGSYQWNTGTHCECRCAVQDDAAFTTEITTSSSTQWLNRLYANACPYIARQSLTVCNGFPGKLDHHSYSPSLSSYFNVFPALKQHMSGQNFQSNNDVKTAAFRCFGILTLIIFVRHEQHLTLS